VRVCSLGGDERSGTDRIDLSAIRDCRLNVLEEAAVNWRIASERSSRDNGAVKSASVASDKELLAHDRKISAWTQFIHTAITRKTQKQQHIDADDCLAVGEELVAVLAVQWRRSRVTANSCPVMKILLKQRCEGV